VLGRGDDPHIHATGLGRPHAHELAILEQAYQLRLQVERQHVDRGEENRAAIGELDPPLARADRAGECASLVAEQLALDQRRRQRRAVDPDERPMAPRTAIVNGPRAELLAGARFADEQHRGVGARDLAHTIQHLPERRTVADEVVEPANGVQLLAQVGGLGLLPGRQIRQLRVAQPQHPRLAAPVDGRGDDLGEQLHAREDLVVPGLAAAESGERQGTDAVPADDHRNADRRPDRRAGCGAVAGRERSVHSRPVDRLAAGESIVHPPGAGAIDLLPGRRRSEPHPHGDGHPGILVGPKLEQRHPVSVDGLANQAERPFARHVDVVGVEADEHCREPGRERLDPVEPLACRDRRGFRHEAGSFTPRCGVAGIARSVVHRVPQRRRPPPPRGAPPPRDAPPPR
jgi:hypothetical protein